MSTKKRFTAKRKCICNTFIVIVLIVFFLWFLPITHKKERIRTINELSAIINIESRLVETNFNEEDKIKDKKPKYIVNTSKCKIKKLDPFDRETLPFQTREKYVSCGKRGLLTYVKKRDNVSTLYIDEQRIKEYTKGNIYCCYSKIIPSANITEDNPIDSTVDSSLCQHFDRSVTMSSDFIIVFCFDDTSREVYRNVHAAITIKKEIKYRMELLNVERKKQPNVLLIGIDSVSQQNLIRSLPLTYFFLQDSNWLEFKAYSKISDNSFSNLIALLTGLNETTALKICDPQMKESLDKCKMIWNNYRDLGYITAYAEDESHIQTFNPFKKEFRDGQTDYYFRLYVTAAQRYLFGLKGDDTFYCTGPEVTGERIFNLARDFVTTFKHYPNFGVFWMNSYSHDNVSAVSKMDEEIISFFTDLIEHKVFENSIIIFHSNHGFSRGPIMYTHAGWLEDRLPFLYMWIPKWFKKKHPNKYKNLVTNTERLISAYDLYMTLQDILILSEKNYTIKKSSGCPKCRSLFEEADAERSCEDAGIEHHWCACHNYVELPEIAIITRAAKFIVNEIQNIHKSLSTQCSRCSEFKLGKVLGGAISDDNYTMYENVSFLLITLQTIPRAVFQATVSVNLTLLDLDFKLEGDISRVDEYGETSWCVKTGSLKKYCYCKGFFQYLFDEFMHSIRNILSLI